MWGGELERAMVISHNLSSHKRTSYSRELTEKLLSIARRSQFRLLFVRVFRDEKRFWTHKHHIALCPCARSSVCWCDGNDSGGGKQPRRKNSKDISCFLPNRATLLPTDEPSFLLHLFDVIILRAMLIYTVLWLLWLAQHKIYIQ